MKKIIKSLAIIIAVGTIATGATWSYFSDAETSTGNTISAGRLDILLDPNGIVNDQTTGPTLPIALSDLAPGYDGAAKGDYYYPAVANVGTMDFDWKFAFTETGHNSPNGGDLSNVLKVKIEESRKDGAGNPWDYPAGGSFNCQFAGIWDGSYPGATVAQIYTGKVSTYPATTSALTVGKGRCYRVSFYLDSDLEGDDNTYQDASVVYSISADAQQII